MKAQPQDAGLLELPLEQALQRLEATGGAAALYRLAGCAEALAITDLGKALPATARLIALADRLGDTSGRVRARQARAQALAYANRFDEALGLLGEAVDVAETAGAPLDAARARLSMLHGLARQGRYDEALAAGESARLAFVEAGERGLAARADMNLGVTCRMRDEPAEALRHFERAAAGFADEPLLAAQLESNRAEALLDLDRFDEAQASFERALRAFEAAGVRRAAAIVEGNLGDLASRQGRLEEALYHFERARRYLETDRAPGDLARLQIEQAEALLHVGLFEEALLSYRQALPKLETHGLAWEAARAHAGLGRALLELGRLGEAAASLELAAAAFERLGHATGRAKVRLLEGELAARAGDAEAAQRFFAEALAALGDRPADAAATYNRLAALHLQHAELDRAEDAMHFAERIAAPLDAALLTADLLHVRARLRRARGRPGESLDDLRCAADRIEHVRGGLQADVLRTAFLGSRQSVFEELAAALVERGDDASAAEAFHVVERCKSRSLLDVMTGTIELVERMQAASDDPRESALLEEYVRLQGALNALYARLDRVGADAQRSARDDTAEIARCESALRALEGRLASTRAAGRIFARPADAGAVRRHLRPGEALVQYFIAGRLLLAFVVRRDRLRMIELPGDRDELRELVERFQFEIARQTAWSGRAPRPDLPARARQALGSLHERLVAPLDQELGGAHRLIVVPHGMLHLLPFGALHDGGRHLVESVEIVTVPSASLLLRGARRRPAPARRRRALIVGVADDAAPRIGQEVEAVAAALPEAQVLTGPQATAERFVGLARQADLIHLACHGRFTPGNPMLSGVKLADRWLTVRDLYGLRLPGAVVALSACETGVSAAVAGDELVGLTRAFFAAGASALLMGLWMLDDENASILMASMYELWQNGADTDLATALRGAQCRMLRQAPHPATWAPYVLVGEA